VERRDEAVPLRGREGRVSIYIRGRFLYAENIIVGRVGRVKERKENRVGFMAVERLYS
jgi:hypothetical protein